jgi:hypothetical protein
MQMRSDTIVGRSFVQTQDYCQIGVEEPCLHRQEFFDPSGENPFLFARIRSLCGFNSGHRLHKKYKHLYTLR